MGSQLQDIAAIMEARSQSRSRRIGRIALLEQHGKHAAGQEISVRLSGEVYVEGCENAAILDGGVTHITGTVTVVEFYRITEVMDKSVYAARLRGHLPSADIGNTRRVDRPGTDDTLQDYRRAKESGSSKWQWLIDTLWSEVDKSTIVELRDLSQQLKKLSDAIALFVE